MAELPEDEGLWARSEVMPDGTYGVAITVNADFSRSLNRDQALAYAVACHRRAMEAEHDTAVLTMLTHIGVDPALAAEVVARDLRPDRPDTHTATEPLRFTVAIGRAKHPRRDAGAFVPLLKFSLHGREIGELSPADLRGHAGHVLDTLAVADLDAALHRALTGTFGLDDARARAAIGSLMEHWPAREQPRHG